MSTAKVRVCFVCLGNICRSPTAEAIMLRLVEDAGLVGQIAIASAGTGAYHEGQPADARSKAEALSRGVSLIGRARRFTAPDFAMFDYVIAMDHRNQRELERMATRTEDRAKVHRLRTFDAAATDDLDVPDPYQGGSEGFAQVFDICDAGCRGLLAHLRERYEL